VLRFEGALIQGLRWICTATAAAVLLALSTAAVAGAPGTVKPGHKPYGNSYGKWHALGWKSYLEHPVSESPAAGNGTLCGTTDGVLHPHIHGRGTLACTVEAGTPILKPVAVNVCLNAKPSEFPPVKLLPCARKIFEQPFRPDNLSLKLDGERVAHIRRYGAVSPPFRLDLPKDDILSYWGDSGNPRTARGVAAGWLVIFRPLPVGSHRIRSCVTDPDKRQWPPNFSGCHTVNVTVTPPP
jgi:hypothetical protein